MGNPLKKILFLIQQSGVAMMMPRSHNRSLGTTFDTVASHSHHMGIIAYSLCRMEGLSHEDGMKAIAISTFHDLAETRTGDLDFIAKHYAETNEEKAVKDQFAGLEFGRDLENLIEEYEERETKISKLVKDADSLEQMYQEWVLAWQGNRLADKWFESDFNDRVPGFKSESAKKLAFAMKDSNPHEWWWVELTENDSAKDKTKLLGKK